MLANAKAACDNCCACFENYNRTPRKNEKYIFKSCSDKTVPYGYEHSDLKNLYLSSSALNARQDTPVIKTQYQQLVEDK